LGECCGGVGGVKYGNGIVEWSPVIEAIGDAKHFVIIRKRRPDANELLLVPSLGSDYSKFRIRPEFRDHYHAFDRSAKDKISYKIKYLIKIKKVIHLQNVSNVDWNFFGSLFIWTPEHVKNYFKYSRDGFIWVFDLCKLRNEIDLSSLKRSPRLNGIFDFYTSQDSRFKFLKNELAPTDDDIERMGFDSEKVMMKLEEFTGISGELNEIFKMSIQLPPSLTDETMIEDVRRKRRDLAFGHQIKKLYGNACVVCSKKRFDSSGSPEVEAAHIYPKSKNGSDDLRNGIALCKLHHWAFDGGLFSVADDYTIMIYDEVVGDDNYEEIFKYKGKQIRLPADGRFKPHKIFLYAHRRINDF
jgi:hypothetical protein